LGGGLHDGSSSGDSGKEISVKRGIVRAFQALLAVSVACTLSAPPARADAPGPETLRIGYLGLSEKRVAPQPYLDVPPADEGLAGAKLGVEDDNTTGRFTGQQFVIEAATPATDGDLPAALRKFVASGIRFVVADLPEPALLAVAALPEAKDVTVFNAGAADDDLRADKCRANVLDTIPSRAMLADALVQYLVAKQWPKIFLVTGPTETDRAMADAFKRSIAKFGARLVAEKPWTFQPGARRSDTGHYAISAEVARFTQGYSYDMLVVADEDDAFGDYLGYAAYEPRLVAGTQGLVPSAWARPHQEWGATQLQERFLKLAGRWMTSRDYAAWLAVRAIGEAATRTSGVDSRGIDPAKIVAYIRSDKFELAGYKGVPLSFRPWDGQMRQAILLSDPRVLVSVSPQPGFLHQFSELDTLGIDKPESKCRFE
jgi:ABC transporter substrate binding protein (PQQ-dependent alcohol dehydrogenase system)